MNPSVIAAFVGLALSIIVTGGSLAYWVGGLSARMDALSTRQDHGDKIARIEEQMKFMQRDVDRMFAGGLRQRPLDAPLSPSVELGGK